MRLPIIRVIRGQNLFLPPTNKSARQYISTNDTNDRFAAPRIVPSVNPDGARIKRRYPYPSYPRSNLTPRGPIHRRLPFQAHRLPCVPRSGASQEHPARGAAGEGGVGRGMEAMADFPFAPAKNNSPYLWLYSLDSVIHRAIQTYDIPSASRG